MSEDKLPRSCGSCSACCFALGVRQIDKPVFTRCSHACAAGCAIYETRPDPCRVYRCAWLDGFGERRDRPDRLGVILDVVAPPADVRELARMGDTRAQAVVDQAARTIHAREVRRGALSDPRVKRRLEGFTRAGRLVVLKPFMGRALPTGKPL